MYILINTAKTEVRTNYVTSNKTKAKAPKGWAWIDENSTIVKTIKTAMFKKAYAENRKNEYQKQGITTDELIVALWELLIENKPAPATAIQVKRTEIKELYPKV